MAHRFAYDDEIDRIELGEGDWVDIKRRMSYGDQQKVVGRFIKLGLVGKTPQAELDMQSAEILTLLLNIKAWNLKDKEGKDAPINEESISNLDPATAEIIRQEVNKRNPVPKA